MIPPSTHLSRVTYSAYRPVQPRLESQQQGDPSIVPIQCWYVSVGYTGTIPRHYSGNRHYSAYRHFSLFPCVPSGFTGTIAGNLHYSTGTTRTSTINSALRNFNFPAPRTIHRSIHVQHDRCMTMCSTIDACAARSMCSSRGVGAVYNFLS